MAENGTGAEGGLPVSKTGVEPKNGKVTWDSEGHEGGKFHSRKLHVPSKVSGLTLGRGYDMKERSPAEISSDLMKANVPKEKAELISKASKLVGPKAEAFITENKLEDFEITQDSQKLLFEITYSRQEKSAKRRATKADVTEKYGATDWDKLDPAIKEIVVDLDYRGDYTGSHKETLQKHIVANDLEGFTKHLSDKENWKNVPQDRFERRVKFLKNALDEKQKAEKAKQKPGPAPSSTPSPQPSVPIGPAAFAVPLAAKPA